MLGWPVLPGHLSPQIPAQRWGQVWAQGSCWLPACLCQLPNGGLPTTCIIDEEAQRAAPAWHFRATNEASLCFLQ
jgi:hypothetical protein